MPAHPLLSKASGGHSEAFWQHPNAIITTPWAKKDETWGPPNPALSCVARGLVAEKGSIETMAKARKLQQEVEATLKRVQEGCDEWDVVWDKLEDVEASSSS